MDCHEWTESTVTDDDGTCWGCDNFWTDGCPYGKGAEDDDWRAIDPDYDDDDDD